MRFRNRTTLPTDCNAKVHKITYIAKFARTFLVSQNPPPSKLRNLLNYNYLISSQAISHLPQEPTESQSERKGKLPTMNLPETDDLHAAVVRLDGQIRN